MKKLGDALPGAMPIRRPGKNGSAARPIEAGCPICKGAGYLRADVPYGDPLFGRLIPCECRAAEVDKRDYEDLQRISNLEPFRDKTFENFDRTVKGVEKAARLAEEFAKSPDGWLVLVGGYGCGKTHLAAAIANYSIQKRFPTFFTVVPDLLDHLRSTFGPTSEIQYDELFDKVRTTPLIILDDLGTENATPWAREKLYQIVNHRYNYGWPTVITINTRALREIDDRIRSRIQDKAICNPIEIVAEDYRPRAKGERQRRPRR